MVFSEAVGDPAYDTETDNWPKGQMPGGLEILFDYAKNTVISGMITKVFDQASFGKLPGYWMLDTGY